MIRINIDKAKGIAHDARRAARSLEFSPPALFMPIQTMSL